MKRFLILIALATGVSATQTGYAQDMTGTWSGRADIAGASLRLVFHLAEDGGTMDSPDQGAMGIPITTATWARDTLRLSIVPLNFSYTGVLRGEAIEGSFTQMGQTFPLNLTRGEIVRNRPQEPRGPFPYRSEEVVFENRSADIRLAGTLTLPSDGEGFPAVVLLTGSGAQNRDEELFGHKPFLVLADHLTRRGIAVLRFDDRGVGGSGGDYASASIQDFATDALAAVEWLKTRKEIDGNKVGLSGHSQGCSMAFIAASTRPENIAFIVSMAGVAANPADNLKEQRRLLLTAMGRPQEFIDANEQLVEKIAAVVEKYGAENIRRDAGEYVGELTGVNLLTRMMTVNDLEAQLRIFASPEMQSMLNYDAATHLRAIKCPVLALNGEKDLQVIADMNLVAIRSYVAEKQLTVKKYAGLNHLFQTAETGAVEEYGQIEETISPQVLTDIAEWILKNTKRCKQL